MAANIRETDALNLETVEAIAILRRLQQCMHMGISHLIIESNCQFVVDKIRGEDHCSHFGNLLSNIKEWMEKFIDFQIKFAYQNSIKWHIP